MSYPVDTIETFLNQISLKGRVLSFSNDGTDTTLILENSYHLREKRGLKIDDVSYTAKSVVARENKVVIEGVLSSAKEYEIDKPFFFHGTNYILNAELSYLEDEEKVPLFYMEGLFESDTGGDDSDYITTDFNFVLADNANYEDWQSDDYVSNRLVGLRKLAIKIDKEIKNYPLFDEVSGARIVDYYKYGLYAQREGVVNSLFNERLTGTHISVSIPVGNCKC